MKKVLLTSLLLISFLGLMGCATPQEVVVQEPAAASNSALDSLPDWILTTPKSADMHFAVGTAIAVNLPTAIKRAEAEGRTAISQWISIMVKSAIKTFVNDAGSGNDRQNIDAFEAISVQVSQNSLNGVTRDKLFQGDDGTVYVLMGIPLANVQKAFEPASNAIVNTFSKNEAADVANARLADGFYNLLNGDV